jgi:hypothetical protein
MSSLSVTNFPSSQYRNVVKFDGSKLSIPQGEANLLIKDNLIRVLGPIMKRFEVFSYMQLTNKGTFKITKLKSAGLNLQPAGDPCSWSPSKGVYTESAGAVVPCEVKAEFEMCVGDYENTCYADLIYFDRIGKIAGANGNITPEAAGLVSMITDVLRDSLAQDTMSVFSSGQVYKGVSVEFRDEVDNDTQIRFKKQMEACMGYGPMVEAVAKSNAKHSGSYINNLINPEECVLDCGQPKYIGDAEGLIMSIRKRFTADLNTVYLTKGMQLAGKFADMVTIVSQQIFARLEEQYQAYCNDSITKFNCIVPEKISLTTTTADGMSYTQEIEVFRVHGIVVIPDPMLNFYDQFVKASFFFVGITVAGNINVGTNYGSIDRDASQYPLRIEIKRNLEDEGKIKMKTESLF